MNAIYEFWAGSVITAIFVADVGSDAVSAWRESYDGGRDFHRNLTHEPTLAPRWIAFEGELDFRTSEPVPKQALDFVKFSPASALGAVRDSVLERTEKLWGLVEVLPLRCRDDDYSAIHAARHYDVLDLDDSTYGVPRGEFVWTSGTLGALTVMGFSGVEGLQKVDLFRVPERTAMFCTQGFLDRLRELRITGYGARQVWPPTEEQLAEEARLLALQRAGKLHGEMHFRPEALEA